MDSFIFALNAVLPLIIMVACGYFLKRIGMISKDFVKMANKLVFRFFLPIMLFLNIYNIDSIGSVQLGFVFYTLLVTGIIFLLAIPFVRVMSRDGGSRGVLIQSTFRSNFALIGIPLATSLFGAEGGAAAAVLSAFTIPLLNVLAVISLTMFKKQEGATSRIKDALINIAKNPLILGVLSGLLALAVRALFVHLNISFRLSDLTPVYKAATTLSSVSTPLALIVLGAQFEFSVVKDKSKEIIFGTLSRIVVSPLIGLGIAALLFRDVFTGAQFAAMCAAFLTPVAVSSVPMAQEMDADTDLAGQLVVWTTLLSAFTVFLGVYILSLVGIFPT